MTLSALLANLRSKVPRRVRGGRSLVSAQVPSARSDETPDEAILAPVLRDPLTGLPSRRHLLDLVERSLTVARANDRHLAILSCDVDHFTMVNDGMGYDLADLLLRAVAVRLGSTIGVSTGLIRTVGDEFVAVCEVESESEACAIAERLREALVPPFVVEKRAIAVTLSVGVALDRPHSTVASLLRDASTALYHAKHRGRDRYALFDDDLHRVAISRLSTEDWLRKSLQDDGLEVHFQPIVSLATGRIVAAEALVRGIADDGSMLWPGQFLDVARSAGLLPWLDAWVLEKSVEALVDWRNRWGADAPALACNLSSHDIGVLPLDVAVCGLLDRHDLPGSCLWLELSETMVFGSTAEQVEALHILAARGVVLAVDDFGTGYSSLTRLAHFPVAVLKADREFVNNLPGSQRDEALVGIIGELARALQMRSVAEGVERANQIDPLRHHGYELVQGFFFSPAVPAERFIELVLDHERFADLAGVIDIPLWSPATPLLT